MLWRTARATLMAMGSAGEVEQGDFLVPCVLLILQRGPCGAEELRALVAAFGFRQRATQMQGPLQQLRDDQLIDSVGPSSGEADASPRYALTAAGQRWLADRAQALAEPARLVERFLDRYTVTDVLTPPASGTGSAKTDRMD